MYNIGVDLGGTNIAVGIVTLTGEIKAKASVKTFNQRPFEEIMKDMADCILKLIADNGVTLDEIGYIGIGTPGTVNDDDGILVYANNFADAVNVPMRKLLQKYIDKPVYMSNDANVAALGETISGAAKGLKNVVMITLGTGVGGGIVIDGKIYEGKYCAGAELGHIELIADGELCSCGRYGCWEAYASATALIRQTKVAMKKNPDSIMCQTPEDKVSGRTAFDAARKGDAAAKAVVDKYIRYIADGLCDMVNIFRPDVLIIGGGICNEGEFLLAPIREYIRNTSYANKYIPEQVIKTAELGNDAGIIGAGLLRG